MPRPRQFDLFSWRSPAVFALFLIGGMGASFAWANSGPARFYTDPSRAAVECEVAASLGAELATERPGAAFWGTLVGIAPDRQSTLLSRSAKTLLVWPLQFDCSSAFAKRGLTVVTEMPSDIASPAWYRFSRIALSENGRVATVGMTMWCFRVCDSAQFETVSRQEGRHWGLVRRVRTTIID